MNELSGEAGVRANYGLAWALHPCVRGVGMVERQRRSGEWALRAETVQWGSWPSWVLGWEMFGSYPRPFVRSSW